MRIAVISFEKFGFYTDRSQICKKKDMKESLETAYEDFASIAGSSWNKRIKEIALKDLYDRLGDDSDAFDNMVYDRLGLSAEEALEMFDAGETLP